MGCFWNKAFSAIGNLFRKVPILGSILQIAAAAICTSVGGPAAGAACGAAASAFVAGVTSGKLGEAMKSGLISLATSLAFMGVGDVTLGPGHPTPPFGEPTHLANIAGHAAVGCLSAVASGGKCGPGAASAAAGASATPLINTGNLYSDTLAHAAVGGLASVAGGGKFANGAVTAAFGYLFNGALGKAFGANAAGIVVGIAAAETGPLDPVLIMGARIVGGIVGSLIEDYVFSSSSERDPRRLFNEDEREEMRDKSRDADGDPTCEYCGKKTTTEPRQTSSSTGDHETAWARGGRTDTTNGNNACLSCNSSKGSKDLGIGPGYWTPPLLRPL